MKVALSGPSILLLAVLALSGCELFPVASPDLMVASTSSYHSGAGHGLMYISAKLQNVGHADAPATTWRFTASNTELWKAAVPAIRVGETWESDEIAVIAPLSLGTVVYRLCVDPVPGEGDASNCYVQAETVDSRLPSYWRRAPYLITDSDPSSYIGLGWVGENRIRVAYSGQSPRSVYVYEARYADQQTISVMVDQGFSRSRADELAIFYARRAGQLPARSALDELAVFVCYESDGPYQACQGYASRGEQNQIAIFHEDRPDTLGYFMLHEYGHLAYDGVAYASATWRAAVAADDRRFITAYARDFPYREDVAESYVAWFAVRCSAERLAPPDEAAFIRSAIPARLAYFDDLLGGTRSCPRRE